MCEALDRTYNGVWSAFWLFQESSTASGAPPPHLYDEVDIYEFWGNDPNTHSITTHFHYDCSDSWDGTWDHHQVTTGVADSSLWHIYGVDWSPEELVYYQDGMEVYRVRDGECVSSWWYNLFHTPKRVRVPKECPELIVSLCPSESGANVVDSNTPEYSEMEVDWVRIWTRPSYSMPNYCQPTCGGGSDGGSGGGGGYVSPDEPQENPNEAVAF